jgi:hypothetical protein
VKCSNCFSAITRKRIYTRNGVLFGSGSDGLAPSPTSDRGSPRSFLDGPRLFNFLNSSSFLLTLLRPESKKFITWFNYRQMQVRWAWVVVALMAIVVISSIVIPRATGETGKHNRVFGAGRTIIEGGTGGNSPLPVTTLVAFHADAQGGDFECLAFLPSHAAGAGSGEFDSNVMYVTGKVTSSEIGNGVATLRGTATVTGLGAGQELAFTALVHAGGPGTTIKLDVSGLTFPEILVDGHISMD